MTKQALGLLRRFSCLPQPHVRLLHSLCLRTSHNCLWPKVLHFDCMPIFPTTLWRHSGQGLWLVHPYIPRPFTKLDWHTVGTHWEEQVNKSVDEWMNLLNRGRNPHLCSSQGLYVDEMRWWVSKCLNVNPKELQTITEEIIICLVWKEMPSSYCHFYPKFFTLACFFRGIPNKVWIEQEFTGDFSSSLFHVC